ncbi:hemolysin family protein [Liquorilactobacillus oeni]|uniref:Ion Mg(2+) C(O2+) transport protein n=1 Tax=Liquorilactobacillus oeni DSM 19972 TaxID=1423777 RepID=A0A0R1MDK9_9LACO|nr:hemolysin family protein [Liquorilactobacillus oeni]KRL05985.1 ion Mg(2+) C(o2+) transport protein [Liquorilactobacillus oeni DSM 19972]
MNSDPGLAKLIFTMLAVITLVCASILRSFLLIYHSHSKIESDVFGTLEKHEQAVSLAQFFFYFFSILCATEIFISQDNFFSVKGFLMVVVFCFVAIILSTFLTQSLYRIIIKYNFSLLRAIQRFAVICSYPFILIELFLAFINRSKKNTVSSVKAEKTSASVIEALITEQRDEGRLNSEAFEMIEGVISMHKKMAREVMVARTDAFMVDIQNDNDRNIDAILQMPYSRVPVFNENKDNIVGIVHIKNILRTARKNGFDHVTIRRVMQPALFIPETMPIDEVMFEMQKTKNQIAILFDEYGGVVGLVTLEDLIEEIVGEIEDESDHPDRGYQKISDNEFIVQGRLALDDFNNEFGTALEMNDVDTIAGYMIAKLGFIPEDDSKEKFETAEHIVLTTEKVDDSRIMALRVILPPALAIARVRREKSQR